MGDTERRALIRQYWEHTGRDQDVSHEIFHDDAVLEFPQSGERFEGVANFKEWRRQYPAGVTLEMRNLRGDGDLWVVEGVARYDDGPERPGINILEFKGDKVIRETIYVTEEWDAPEWRAPWRAAP
jgi:SnoaL-like domain